MKDVKQGTGARKPAAPQAVRVPREDLYRKKVERMLSDHSKALKKR